MTEFDTEKRILDLPCPFDAEVLNRAVEVFAARYPQLGRRRWDTASLTERFPSCSLVTAHRPLSGLARKAAPTTPRQQC